ncbi:hypothetical protein [Helicobacter pametensis]|uniref:hypothetical protein n=1 Tax=Helicobacter pametensis TaxID=95149 RepID=UPI0004826F10|nr:hypothetical protein [Helicobacter pametensis]
MTSENFIGLSVVSGFFVGLIFALIGINEPEFIILFTLVVTAVFYLIVISGISLFNWFVGFENRRFNKNQLEDNLEYYVSQFKKREEELVRVLDYIKRIELGQEEKEKQSLS